MIKENQEYFIWHKKEDKECLMIATLVMCECCGKPSITNSAWVMNYASDLATSQADAIKEKHGELTECQYDEVTNKTLCEDCYE